VKDEKWIPEKRKGRTYLFPKDNMEKIYKAYYLKRIHTMLRKNELQVHDQRALENILNDIAQQRWNVYAKRPFGDPCRC